MITLTLRTGDAIAVGSGIEGGCEISVHRSSVLLRFNRLELAALHGALGELVAVQRERAAKQSSTVEDG